MADLIALISAATASAKTILALNEDIKNADIKKVISELIGELADMRVKVANVQNENADLMQQILALKASSGDFCPFCKNSTYELMESNPHPTMGEAGAMLRLYKCSNCQKSESLFYDPLGGV